MYLQIVSNKMLLLVKCYEGEKHCTDSREIEVNNNQSSVTGALWLGKIPYLWSGQLGPCSSKIGKKLVRSEPS